MFEKLRTPFLLSLVLSALMFAQAVLGLIFPEQYHDVEWIKAAWFGNDWVTLVVVVPLLVAALVTFNRGSLKGCLLWLGILGYAIYNYAYYLFGAALNVFFLLYLVIFLLSVSILFLALTRLDVVQIAAGSRPETPVRLIGGYLVFLGSALAAIWLMMWAFFVFLGRSTPIEPEAFKLVAALDILLIVPWLMMGGLLLWQRKAWGYVLAGLAGVQGSLYLLVLLVNSVVAIQRGLAEPPGQIPVWGTLALLTVAATLLLLTNLRSNPALSGRQALSPRSGAL